MSVTAAFPISRHYSRRNYNSDTFLESNIINVHNRQGIVGNRTRVECQEFKDIEINKSGTSLKLAYEGAQRFFDF